MTGNPTRERKSKADKSASATTAEDPPCAAPSTKDTTPRAEPKAGDAPTAEGRHNGDIKSLSPTPGATPPKLPAGQRRGSGGAIYKLVESGSFEIADHTTDRVRDTRLPQKLVVTVTLPPDAVRGNFVQGGRLVGALRCCVFCSLALARQRAQFEPRNVPRVHCDPDSYA